MSTIVLGLIFAFSALALVQYGVRALQGDRLAFIPGGIFLVMFTIGFMGLLEGMGF